MERIKWIDCAKFVAIFAVLVNHLCGVVYWNSTINLMSYFSVSLFILLSGITTYLGDQKYNETWVQSFVRTVKKIGIAYLTATFVYQIVRYRNFDFLVFLNQLIRFNASGPLYFVCLYIQLMLVQWILFRLLSFPGGGGTYVWMHEVILLIGIILVSWFTNNYTNVLNIYGGGGKLFGGTYLILFYLGMLFAKHNLFCYISNKVSIIAVIICGILYCIWTRFICVNQFRLDAKLPFGDGVNPPGISLVVLAILVCFSIFYAVSIGEKLNIKFISLLLNFMQYFGSCSLYIFLYHRLFLDNFLIPYVHIYNPWINRIIYLFVMIAGPLIMKRMFAWMRSLLYLERE